MNFKRPSIIVALFCLVSCGNPHLLLGDSSSSSSFKPANVPTSQPTTDSPDLDLVFMDQQQEITDYDFGSVAKDKKIEKVITIVNKGNVNAILSNISQATDNQFILADINNCLAVIEPEGKCSFVLNFNATNVGQLSDVVKFIYLNQDNNLVSENSLNVTAITTKPAPTGWLKVSWTFNGGANADFGKSRVEDGTVIYVTLKNEDQVDAFLSQSSITNNEFSILDNDCLNKIPAQSSCTVKIKFDSSVAGLHSSPINLKFSDESGDLMVSLETDLKGEKVAGSVAPVVAVSDFDAPGLNFGAVTLGSKYNKLLEISNKNNQDLVVSLDEINFTGSKDFSFAGGEFPGTRGTCKKLVTTGRCLIELTFNPKNLGQQNNLLTIKSSAQNVLKTTLSGKGVENTNNSCQNKSDYLFFAEGKFDLKDSSIVYPYHTSLSSTPQKLSLLYGLETNKRYSCANCEAVQDSMVLNRYNNLNWPKSDFLQANLQVHVGKTHNTRKWLYTEMLCMQNTVDRICSGELFNKEGEKSWYALLNKSFFNTRPGPINIKFNNMLFDDQSFTTQTTSDGLKIDNAMIMKTLNLADLYDLSQQRVENILRAGFLNVILVDDLKSITYPRLQVTSKKDMNCEQII